MRIGWRMMASLGGLLVAAACASPLASSSRTAALQVPVANVAMPGPAPRRPGIDAVALNKGCVACHPAVAAEWSDSMHRRAYVDPVFQQALSIEPLPFCRGCHAPEADPTRAAPQPLADLGIACVSCHLVDGVVLAAPRAAAPDDSQRDPQPDPHRDPHRDLAPPVRRQADFGTTAACAACHEFAFPDPRPGGAVELMQSTISEAARSPFADDSCARCHMPAVAGAPERRSHSFASTRSPAALARALAVRVERDANGVLFTIEPRGVGHAFPTGDLFRRVTLVAEAIGNDMNIIARARRHLARHFASRPNTTGLGRTLRADDRPGGRDHGHGPLRVALDLGAASQGAEVVWQVVYERVAHPAAGDPDEAVVADAVVLAEGRLR